MTRSVLDTSVLLAEAVERPGEETAISVLSLAEMQLGVLLAKDDRVRGARLTRLSAIERIYDPLPVDGAVASSYAMLAAATRRAGRKASTRTIDLLIAATAHAHGAALVTANPRDVEHLSDLVTIVSAV